MDLQIKLSRTGNAEDIDFSVFFHVTFITEMEEGEASISFNFTVDAITTHTEGHVITDLTEEDREAINEYIITVKQDEDYSDEGISDYPTFDDVSEEALLLLDFE